MVMPQMNGVELYRQISDIRRLNVLYMSGYTDTGAIDRGALAVGTPLLQKPFTAAALNQKVREALSQLTGLSRGAGQVSNPSPPLE